MSLLLQAAAQVTFVVGEMSDFSKQLHEDPRSLFQSNILVIHLLQENYTVYCPHPH